MRKIELDRVTGREARKREIQRAREIVRQHSDPTRDYACEWRRWRKAHGWTQAQMASVLWVSVRTIIGIERGYHRPSLTTIEKMDQLQKRYEGADHAKDRTSRKQMEYNPSTDGNPACP